jgi:hypothetical protein
MLKLSHVQDSEGDQLNRFELLDAILLDVIVVKIVNLTLEFTGQGFQDSTIVLRNELQQVDDGGFEFVMVLDTALVIVESDIFDEFDGEKLQDRNCCVFLVTSNLQQDLDWV